MEDTRAKVERIFRESKQQSDQKTACMHSIVFPFIEAIFKHAAELAPLVGPVNDGNRISKVFPVVSEYTYFFIHCTIGEAIHHFKDGKNYLGFYNLLLLAYFGAPLSSCAPRATPQEKEQLKQLYLNMWQKAKDSYDTVTGAFDENDPYNPKTFFGLFADRVSCLAEHAGDPEAKRIALDAAITIYQDFGHVLAETMPQAAQLDWTSAA
jgi:hypothetical protein